MPARGLVGCLPGLASHALATRPVRGLVDECALTGALHTPPLPLCGLSRGLRNTSGAVGFVRALGVAICGLDESASSLRAAAGPAVIVHDHAVPGIGLVTVLSCGRGVGDQG